MKQRGGGGLFIFREENGQKQTNGLTVMRYFALQKHTQLHHLVRVAGALEGMFLVHVLSWPLTWERTQGARWTLSGRKFTLTSLSRIRQRRPGKSFVFSSVNVSSKNKIFLLPIGRSLCGVLKNILTHSLPEPLKAGEYKMYSVFHPGNVCFFY